MASSCFTNGPSGWNSGLHQLSLRAHGSHYYMRWCNKECMLVVGICVDTKSYYYIACAGFCWYVTRYDWQTDINGISLIVVTIVWGVPKIGCSFINNDCYYYYYYYYCYYYHYYYYYYYYYYNLNTICYDTTPCVQCHIKLRIRKVHNVVSLFNSMSMLFWQPCLFWNGLYDQLKKSPNDKVIHTTICYSSRPFAVLPMNDTHESRFVARRCV